MSYPPEKRNFYRILYNPATCPYLKFQGLTLEVMDLSEGGFRFSTQITKQLSVEMDITGSINFRDGESFLVHGMIKRINRNEVTVKLKHPFPLSKIMSEQRRLIRKKSA